MVLAHWGRMASENRDRRRESISGQNLEKVRRIGRGTPNLAS
jgi:hypothetical protein